MKVLKTIMWTSMSAAVLGVCGCDVYVNDPPRTERAYVQQQPVYVEQEPQYIIVQQAPPPVIVERRPVAPSGAYVWIDGYWNWDNQRYSWQVGRYVVPPQQDVVWVAPRYDRDTSGHHYYTAGHWRKQNPGNGRGNGIGFGRGGN